MLFVVSVEGWVYKIRVLIVEVEWAVLGVNLGRPIVTNGTSLRSCARATHCSQITLQGGLVIESTVETRCSIGQTALCQ